MISAPSGAGKTSVVHGLLQTDVTVSLSISYTTRLPRENEVNGRDYVFVDQTLFREMLADGEFLESAEVYGNFYGTSRRWIEETMAAGQDVLLEIDCQGAQQVRQLYPQSTSIFILPPSLEILERRLRQRGLDENRIIERRLSAARDEVGHLNKFDYVVVNHKLDQAVQEVACIMRAERLKTMRQLISQRKLIAQFA